MHIWIKGLKWSLLHFLCLYLCFFVLHLSGWFHLLLQRKSLSIRQRKMILNSLKFTFSQPSTLRQKTIPLSQYLYISPKEDHDWYYLPLEQSLLLWNEVPRQASQDGWVGMEWRIERYISIRIYWGEMVSKRKNTRAGKTSYIHSRSH